LYSVDAARLFKFKDDLAAFFFSNHQYISSADNGIDPYDRIYRQATAWFAFNCFGFHSS
jgi:hypothetical protein